MAGPIKKWSRKGLELAAWEGNTGKRFSIQKRYKDKNSGEWKESKSIFKEELGALREMIDEALLWLTADEAGERTGGGFTATADIVRQVQAVIPGAKTEDVEDIPW